MSETETTTVVEEWAEDWTNGKTAYNLSSVADCGSPDSVDSAGARMLESVVSSVIDAVEYDPEGARDEIAHEAADAAPDVYTHKRWQEFVDLAAYNEEPDLIGEWPSDLTEAAGYALYQIAERLASAMLADLEDRES